MTAASLLSDLSAAGIHLRRHGDRLHVEAKPGTLTAELRDRLTANKPELLALLADTTEAMRAHMLALAEAEGRPAAIVQRLDADDLAACHGWPVDVLRAYLLALDWGATMDAGRTPPGYTMPASCRGCGPVWLWPGAPAHVIACPWCFRRNAGKAIPRPAEVTQ